MNLEEALDLAAMDGVTIKKEMVQSKDGLPVFSPVRITIHANNPDEKPITIEGFDEFIKHMEYRMEVESAESEPEETDYEDDEVDTDDYLGPNPGETWENIYNKD